MTSPAFARFAGAALALALAAPAAALADHQDSAPVGPPAPEAAFSDFGDFSFDVSADGTMLNNFRFGRISCKAGKGKVGALMGIPVVPQGAGAAVDDFGKGPVRLKRKGRTRTLPVKITVKGTFTNAMKMKVKVTVKGKGCSMTRSSSKLIQVNGA